MREFLIRLSRLALFFAICWIVYSVKVKPLLPFAIAAVLMVAARIALGFCEKRYKGLTVKEFFAREITLPLMMDVLLLGSSVYYIFKPGHVVWFNGLVALLAVLDIARHGLRNRM